MLSKNKIKLLRSLDQKKYRSESALFVAEGEKLVFDLLNSAIEISGLYCTPNLVNEVFRRLPDMKVEIVTKEELSKISFLKTTPEIIAVCTIPKSEIDWDEITGSLSVFLDEIQDPGNLGTIVRVADWFGIKNLICSEGCADLYNPKVIQSTMGAFARVKVHYVELNEFLGQAHTRNIPIYGTYLEGENLYKCDLTPTGIIVMGNEGNGISAGAARFISTRITIPSFPPNALTSESLNVSIATSVLCAEFRRQFICRG